MASKNVTRALRNSNLRQISSNAQRRTFVSALNAASRTTAKPAFVAPTAVQQRRGMKTIDFAGTKEVVYGASAAPSTAITQKTTVAKINFLQSVKTGRPTSYW